MYKVPTIAKNRILCYAHLLNRFRVRKGHTHVQYFIYCIAPSLIPRVYLDYIILLLVDTSMLEETEENKKSFKIVMFDSQESRVNRSQGLTKEKEGTFKTLGLVAAQCNGIAACAYFWKIFTVLYIHYCTWLYMVCNIRTSFLSLVLISGPKMTLFEVNCWNDLFSLPFENGLVYPVWFDRACYARVNTFFVSVL